MNASVTNQKTRIKLQRKEIFKKIKESNKEHFVNLCKSNNFESHTPSSLIPVYATNSELPRNLFPIKSTK